MNQQNLFSTESHAIEGLRYTTNFIDAATETRLLRTLQNLPFREAEYKGFTAKRRIVSYGGAYDFSRNELRPAEPVPPFLYPLRECVGAWLDRTPEEFTHVLIAEYRPGTQLGWHRDVPNFESVVGISLLGPARLRLRPYPPLTRKRAMILDLAPRSIYLLEGTSRWEFQHSIAPTKVLRYSITFRTLRHGPPQ